MIKQGLFVRCPIDLEHPSEPRIFTRQAKLLDVNDFNESAHIVFEDPFGYRKYFDFIPKRGFGGSTKYIRSLSYI